MSGKDCLVAWPDADRMRRGSGRVRCLRPEIVLIELRRAPVPQSVRMGGLGVHAESRATSGPVLYSAKRCNSLMLMCVRASEACTSVQCTLMTFLSPVGYVS